MFAIVAVALVVAQTNHSHADGGRPFQGRHDGTESPVLQLAEKPLPLRKGIGTAHDAVATSSREAQAFYDQGLAYLHSYVWLEAARSFNQALRLDPNLAIAYAELSLA